MKKIIFILFLFVIFSNSVFSQGNGRDQDKENREVIQQIRTSGLADILSFQTMNNGVGSFVEIQQVGNQNRANISQQTDAGSAFANQAYSIQQGNSNEMTVGQIGSSNLLLGLQLGYITYELDRNTKNQFGSDPDTDNAFASGNENKVNQSLIPGEGNELKVNQLGNNNVVVAVQQGSENKTIPAEKVLLSVGRRPASEGIGLESLGVYCERGAIKTDVYLQTNIPGVYAAGDINGRSMLAHTAYREAEVSVNHMLGKPDRMNYDAIPGVIYTNPEVAFVGETEASARQKGFSVKTVKLPMQYSGRYVAENEGGNGFCKIIFDQKQDRLLGVHLVGNSASEIIYGAGMLIDMQLPLNVVKRMIFPHPTVSEIIREAIYQL